MDYIDAEYCKQYQKVLNFTSIEVMDWMDQNIVANMTAALKKCSSVLNYIESWYVN